jgi:hypothetical protein
MLIGCTHVADDLVGHRAYQVPIEIISRTIAAIVAMKFITQTPY